MEIVYRNTNLKDLGMKIGLEFHQQIKAPYSDMSESPYDSRIYGSKLFCQCPAVIREEKPDVHFLRSLRAVSGETGQIDTAALFEHKRSKAVRYHGYSDSTCSVEYDAEPIHKINSEAVRIAMLAACQLFNMNPVSEILPVRKIIVDGSNVAGFQRTMLVATGTPDSYITINGNRIHLDTLILEEDSAKAYNDPEIEENSLTRSYTLDRLGIPLLEITTAPDIKNPDEVIAVASHIGTLLRLTNSMKRGQGTIRQDLNVSIKDGVRTEIKGVQELQQLSLLAKNEALRQNSLTYLIERLRQEVKNSVDFEEPILDLSSIFEQTECKRIVEGRKRGKQVYGLKIVGLHSFIGFELFQDYRLGSELSGRIKIATGLGGLFHSDELPKYGITEEEIAKIKEGLECKENDAFLLFVCSEEQAENAGSTVIDFLQTLHKSGLIPEVRQAKPDGKTDFLRPIPGSNRMYPETDALPIEVTEKMIKEAKDVEIESFEERKERYVQEYKLSSQLAEELVLHPDNQLFEDLCKQTQASPVVIAVTILETTVALQRSNIQTENIKPEHYQDIFSLLSQGMFDSKSIPEILTKLSSQPDLAIKKIIKELNLELLSQERVEEIVSEVIQENLEIIEQRKHAAKGLLMGLCMKRIDKKASGKIVASLLDKQIKQYLD